MKYSLLLWMIAYPLFCHSQRPAKLTIDLNTKGPELSAMMYGVFFEDINHAGDGGLYAELIQNRGFEDNTVPAGMQYIDGFAVAPELPEYRNGKIKKLRLPWNIHQCPGWTVDKKGNAAATHALTKTHPLNNATPQSLHLTISHANAQENIQLVNSGFWGINVVKGEPYKLRFFVRTGSNYLGNVVVNLVSKANKILVQKKFDLPNDGNWHEFKTDLVPSGSDTQAALTLNFDATGDVYVDYVSLFPRATFNNRENGLRKDVADLIKDLKPAFIRWPGGCIVEGLTFGNRVKWKETMGDPVQRPGEYSLWGYRNTYGFGYHEYLQFTEDIGARAMFVANIGLACDLNIRNGDFCNAVDLEHVLQDALDAIEYAIGDTVTHWGKMRAAAGHPQKFPLEFIEIGNENGGAPIYDERFTKFQSAIKARYPSIKIISNHGLQDDISQLRGIDYIDPHYYANPKWFYESARTIFDTIRNRAGLQIYVGEYAVLRDVGAGNLDAALSEAAFLIGAERNADIVKMTSYAPLIENSNKRNCPVNMIWLNSGQTFGRSSYYVQKLFSQNRPDYIIPCALSDTGSQLHFVVAGIDTKTNEAIIKMVNAESKPLTVHMGFNRKTSVARAITLSSANLTDENAFDQPKKIYPKEKKLNRAFFYEFPPYSLTIIRVAL